MIDAALAKVPPMHAPWIRYENETEYHKWTIESRNDLPPAWIILLQCLESPSLIRNLEHYTGIPVLQADPNRRGAGLHAMLPNGYLQTHLDYAIHPSGMERRANLILSLNDMNPVFGGGTQLCTPTGAVVKTVYLQRNEALVWPCGDDTYHGVEALHNDSPVRYTAASYYLGQPRTGVNRRRALFIPRR